MSTLEEIAAHLQGKEEIVEPTQEDLTTPAQAESEAQDASDSDAVPDSNAERKAPSIESAKNVLPVTFIWADTCLLQAIDRGT